MTDIIEREVGNVKVERWDEKDELERSGQEWPTRQRVRR